MATVIRTDKPRLVDADGLRIPRLTQIVEPVLSAEDRAFNKAERKRFEDRYGDIEEQDDECERCERRQTRSKAPQARRSDTRDTTTRETRETIAAVVWWSSRGATWISTRW
jgi:hypothetical protein